MHFPKAILLAFCDWPFSLAMKRAQCRACWAILPSWTVFQPRNCHLVLQLLIFKEPSGHFMASWTSGSQSWHEPEMEDVCTMYKTKIELPLDILIPQCISTTYMVKNFSKIWASTIHEKMVSVWPYDNFFIGLWQCSTVGQAFGKKLSATQIFEKTRTQGERN